MSLKSILPAPWKLMQGVIARLTVDDVPGTCVPTMPCLPKFDPRHRHGMVEGQILGRWHRHGMTWHSACML